MLEVPELGRVAELESVGHEHRAHRAVGDDRASRPEQLLPGGHRTAIVHYRVGSRTSAPSARPSTAAVRAAAASSRPYVAAIGIVSPRARSWPTASSSAAPSAAT